MSNTKSFLQHPAGPGARSENAVMNPAASSQQTIVRRDVITDLQMRSPAAGHAAVEPGHTGVGRSGQYPGSGAVQVYSRLSGLIFVSHVCSCKKYILFSIWVLYNIAQHFR